MADPIVLEPYKVTWWATMAGKLAGALLALYLVVGWVAGNVFHERLEEFHKIAKPAILKPIEANSHAIDNNSERIHALETQIAVQNSVLTEMKKQQDKMDAKLDTLIRRGNGG